jgi:hypothetical protein
MNVLIGAGLLVCTCAAYDVDVGHFWGTLMQAVGLRQKAPPREIIVEAGQGLTVEGRRLTLTAVPPEMMAQRLAWAGIRLKDGWVAFQGQTLESVVDELNRHNACRLEIGDVAIGQLRMGGKFRVTDIDGFLAALAVTHGVKAVRIPPRDDTPEVIVLVRDGPGSAHPEGASDWPLPPRTR